VKPIISVLLTLLLATACFGQTAEQYEIRDTAYVRMMVAGYREMEAFASMDKALDANQQARDMRKMAVACGATAEQLEYGDYTFEHANELGGLGVTARVTGTNYRENGDTQWSVGETNWGQGNFENACESFSISAALHYEAIKDLVNARIYFDGAKQRYDDAYWYWYGIVMNAYFYYY
jgi:hypothetical protein